MPVKVVEKLVNIPAYFSLQKVGQIARSSPMQINDYSFALINGNGLYVKVGVNFPANALKMKDEINCGPHWMYHDDIYHKFEEIIKDSVIEIWGENANSTPVSVLFSSETVITEN
jgi:hypothetical protein